VGVRESQKHFHVQRKPEFWEKGRKTKNKGEEPRGNLIL